MKQTTLRAKVYTTSWWQVGHRCKFNLNNKQGQLQKSLLYHLRRKKN